MKKLLVAMLFVSSALYAGYSEQQIGQFRYGYDSDSGVRTTQQQIGQFNYINTTTPSGEMKTTTCQQIGGMTYCN